MDKLLAFSYLSLAIFAAYLLALACFPNEKSSITRVGAAWWLVTCFTLFVPHPGLWLLLCGIALLALAPKGYTNRLMFYCAVLLAAPLIFGWVITLPGIGYFFTLKYPAFLNLILLLPLLFVTDEQGKQIVATTWQRNVVACAIAYTVLTSILDFRDTTFTNGMRYAVNHILTTGLVILVFARARDYEDAAKKIVFGLFLGGAMLVFVGMMQNFQGWYLYSAAPDSLVFGNLNHRSLLAWREGSMRIPGTMNAIPYGTYMALCFIISIYYATRESASKLIWLFSFLFLSYGVFGSGSRGALLMLFLAFGIHFFLFGTKVWLRRLTVMGAALVSILLLTTNLMDVILKADEHGTLGYRVELLVRSIETIKSNPLFGDVNFTEREELQALNWGIVDVVNSYLQVALRYGLSGLVLFCLPVFYAIRHALKSQQSLSAAQNDQDQQLYRVTVTILLSFALAILNVSLMDRLPQYFWILTFVCCGLHANATLANMGARKKKPIVLNQAKTSLDQSGT